MRFPFGTLKTGTSLLTRGFWRGASEGAHAFLEAFKGLVEALMPKDLD